jgi:hypothetical protein
MHVSAAKLFFPMIFYPETSRKIFHPLRVSSENMVPPKIPWLKISFSQQKSARTRGPARLWRLQTQLLGIVQRNFQALGVS